MVNPAASGNSPGCADLNAQADSAPGLPASEPVLSVRNLRILGPSGHAIIEDVSLELRQGEILGVVGESGSGKTTTARALLGYAAPGLSFAAGEVLVGSTDVVGASTRTLRGLRGRAISYVPQNAGRSLNP